MLEWANGSGAAAGFAGGKRLVGSCEKLEQDGDTGGAVASNNSLGQFGWS
jgi:hypothetical protein